MRLCAAFIICLSATMLRAERVNGEPRAGILRVATYNVSLYRRGSGDLVRDLTGGQNSQARRISEVIQRVRPDVLLLNEFDYDAGGAAATLFLDLYLAVGQNGCEPIHYLEHFTAPVNTGRPSGRDFDKDGNLGGPGDAIGYGGHEGQYGMLVLTMHAILVDEIRQFRRFLWQDMPGALLPILPTSNESYYDEVDLAVLSLSSKSLWDVPIRLPVGDTQRRIHLLCSHPTPPIFDGPEDRNGRRNHDEIRMLADYVHPERCGYLVDDKGHRGGLPADARFVIVGDLNCDPLGGDGVAGAIDQLLKHSRINSKFVPLSEGGALVASRYTRQNAGRRGNTASVTSDFTGEGHGKLRVDYVLPSRRLQIIDGGVFWPLAGDPGSDAIRATDHRLVWLDIQLDAE